MLSAAHAGVFESMPGTLADSHPEAEEAQEAEESRHGTLGTSLTVRLNPLQPRLLLASQATSSVCSFACPSSLFG